MVLGLVICDWARKMEHESRGEIESNGNIGKTKKHLDENLPTITITVRISITRTNNYGDMKDE